MNKEEFRRLIISEIDEDGEIGLSILIPWYKKYVLGHEVTYPLFNNKENYNINESQFKELVNIVIGILDNNNFTLAMLSSNWSSVSKEGMIEIINSKKNYLPFLKKPYFLVTYPIPF